MSEIADPLPESRRGSFPWLWIAALAALTLLFLLSFFNRFVGLRSGDGEFVSGIWFLRGKLPYRDYFNATPPLNALKSALLLKVFGPAMIVNRISGVCERVLIAVVVFLWLRRLFAARFAFVAALATIVLSTGDLVDSVASYNHDAILWAILSGFCASFVLGSVRPGRVGLFALLSGLFAGLSLITKQTVGLGAAVAIPVAVGLLLLNGRAWRGAAAWSAGFLAGCGTPVVCLALWLHSIHAWRTFLSMAFLKGPAAKGGHPGAFVERAWMVAEMNWFLVALALVAVALTAGALLRSQGRPAAEFDEGTERRMLVRLGVAFAVAIGSAELLHSAGLGAVHNLSKAAVYYAFLLCGVMVAGYATAALSRRLSLRQQQFALFAAVSFFIAFFLSLSWPAFEPMALPGLGLLVAASLDGAGRRGRRAICAVLGVMVFLQVLEKLDAPFGFDHIVEQPVRLETQASTIAELRGLRLAPGMNEFLNGTLKTIATQSTAADTIFTYPEMGLLYPLSGRGYPTLSASHNVDVVNDAFASEEAARLLAARPAVVIYYRVTTAELAAEDKVWRFGQPSGQHILIRAVEKLIATYRLAGTYSVGQDRRPILVYVRP